MWNSNIPVSAIGGWTVVALMIDYGITKKMAKDVG